jgi:hypothetical protein
MAVWLYGTFYVRQALKPKITTRAFAPEITALTTHSLQIPPLEQYSLGTKAALDIRCSLPRTSRGST